MPQEDIQKILGSYEVCEGNSLKASKMVEHAPSTIIGYWRSAGFEIQKPGPRKSLLKFNLISDMVERDY